MLWLAYSALFLLLLISVFRMLWRQGKWAWILFFGLLVWTAAYIGLFVLPVSSAPSLHGRPMILTAILLSGSLAYFGLMYYGIRRVAIRMKEGAPRA